MNTDECSICFEAFTPDSGHSVLGCGHKFHLMCVVHWFQEQEGPSTCPCCRRESGRLDNVPLVEEESDAGSGSGDDDDGSIGSWTVDEGGEDDDEDVGELRPVWKWDDQHGIWERRWVVSTDRVYVWDPTNEETGREEPEEMTEGAVALQRIWRGWRVRRQQPAVMPQISVTLQRPMDDWHYQRFIRVD
jgi:hypothetical protein